MTANKVLSVSKEIHLALKKEAVLTNQGLQQLVEKLLRDYLEKSSHDAVKDCLTQK